MYKQKKYDDAISNYQRGLNYVKKEDRHLFEYNIGNSYYQKKDYRNAINSYIKTLRLNPKDINSKKNLELARKKLKEKMQQEKKHQQQKSKQKKSNKNQKGQKEQQNNQKKEQANQQQNKKSQQTKTKLIKKEMNQGLIEKKIVR